MKIKRQIYYLKTFLFGVNIVLYFKKNKTKQNKTKKKKQKKTKNKNEKGGEKNNHAFIEPVKIR